MKTWVRDEAVDFVGVMSDFRYTVNFRLKMLVATMIGLTRKAITDVLVVNYSYHYVLARKMEVEKKMPNFQN
jgi:hypothetical protein